MKTEKRGYNAPQVRVTASMSFFSEKTTRANMPGFKQSFTLTLCIAALVITQNALAQTTKPEASHNPQAPRVETPIEKALRESNEIVDRLKNKMDIEPAVTDPQAGVTIEPDANTDESSPVQPRDSSVDLSKFGLKLNEEASEELGTPVYLPPGQDRIPHAQQQYRQRNNILFDQDFREENVYIPPGSQRDMPGSRFNR